LVTTAETTVYGCGVSTAGVRFALDESTEESMKASQLVFGVMALAVTLTGCQESGTRSDVNKAARAVASDVKAGTEKVAAKAGDQLVDGWLTAKIQSKFIADRDIKATDINVSSSNGVVTLKGRVPSESIRTLAVAIARTTDGVKQVVDQLSVLNAGPAAPAPPAPTGGATATTGIAASAGSPRADDARITAGIQAKYFLDDKIKGRRIDVGSRNGIVTLRGEVASDDERAQALLLARTTEGVQRVEDNLSVVIGQQGDETGFTSSTPTPGATEQQTAAPKVDDAALTSRLMTQLSSEPLVKSADIQVTARNGVLVLAGTVPSTAAKQRALTLAREVEGVTQVVDRLRVGNRTK
jgi:hyperosmotically inducible protein